MSQELHGSKNLQTKDEHRDARHACVSPVIPQVEGYSDELHAEVPEDLRVGEHGYKYRVVEGRVMPPYITPARYALSRRVATRSSDICYTSFPKSGSTWLANILYLIINRGETPRDCTLRSCLNWVESSWTYPRSEQELAAQPSPRIFKSHMPWEMALGGNPLANPCKYLYIARNPKDVAVSYFHFESGTQWSGNYSGDWEHWLQMFMEGRVQRDDWFDHVLSWWAHRDADNLLFLKYEDLLGDFDSELQRILDFLGYSLDGDERAAVVRKSSFNHMRRDRFSNHQQIKDLETFFRKGKVGSWREMFTDEQSRAFDELIDKRLAGTGLEFNFG